MEEKQFEDWAEQKLEEIADLYEKTGTILKGGEPIYKALEESYKLGRQTSIMQASNDYNRTVAIALSYGIPECKIREITPQTENVKVLDEAREKLRDLIENIQ